MFLNASTPNGVPEIPTRADRTEIEITRLLDELASYHPPTYDHCRRVASLARQIAVTLALPHLEIRTAFSAGLLHDLGHLLTPTRILSSPESLSEPEWQTVRRHPLAGARMLEKAGLDARIVECVLKHHEQPDGQGYPTGTHQQDPIAAIVAVASTFDTITYTRWLNRAQTQEHALREIRRVTGTQLNIVPARALHELLGEPWD